MATPCPGRNYCNPLTGCPTIGTNEDATWFFGNPGAYTCGSTTCLALPNNQPYCNQNTPYGGTSQWQCWGPSLDYGCSGLPRSDGICVKTSWDNQYKLPCCIGDLDSVGPCDPTWCPQNLEVCQDVLIQYCQNPTNAGTKEICRQFCSLDTNKVYCDAAVAAYCSVARGDPYCNCINSTLPQPECTDPSCTNTNAYINSKQAMGATACPATCSQISGCWNSNTCNITENQFVQSCCAGGTSNASYCQGLNGQGGGGFSIPWFWIILGLVGILALVAVVYFFRRRSN